MYHKHIHYNRSFKLILSPKFIFWIYHCPTKMKTHWCKAYILIQIIQIDFGHFDTLDFYFLFKNLISNLILVPDIDLKLQLYRRIKYEFQVIILYQFMHKVIWTIKRGKNEMHWLEICIRNHVNNVWL